MPFRIPDNDLPGVKNCPHCGKRPFMLELEMMTQKPEKFACCDSGWMDLFDWNLHVERCSVFSEPTPEEDEEFQRLEASQNPEPEWFLADLGRKMERLGKLMQDPETTIADLTGAANDAGFDVRFGIQPTVDGTTGEVPK